MAAAHGDHKDCCFHGFNDVYSARYLLTFRKKVLPVFLTLEIEEPYSFKTCDKYISGYRV
jgi:hypothetical protein